MSLEIFIWVIQILVILFCVSAVVAMVYHVTDLIYRKKISRLEYEKVKKETEYTAGD